MYGCCTIFFGTMPSLLLIDRRGTDRFTERLGVRERSTDTDNDEDDSKDEDTETGVQTEEEEVDDEKDKVG